MRDLSNEELKALLKGAQDGILDLRTMPGYEGNIPPVYYGECTKHKDGSITWEAKYLPIVSKWAWDTYKESRYREPLVKLSREERAEIVKASIFGQIDEEKLPSVYPLARKPRLTDLLYTNFDENEEEDLPGCPEEWHEKYIGFLQHTPGFTPHLFTFSHINNAKMRERREYQRIVEPIDYRTGEPLEDASLAYFYDTLALGFCFGI